MKAKNVFIIFLMLCFGVLVFPAKTQNYTPTYWWDIKPLLDKHCAECHVNGGIAPFSLTSPEAAISHASSIVNATQSGRMPPWPPGEQSAQFINSRKLGKTTKAVFKNWFDAGTPLGLAPKGKRKP